MVVVGVVAVTVIRAISAARELQSDIAVAQGHATSVNMAALSDDLPVVRESALALVEVTDGPVWQVLNRIPWLGTTTTSVAALGQTAAVVSAAGMETRPILASLTADGIRADDGVIDTGLLREVGDRLSATAPLLEPAAEAVQEADPDAIGPVGDASRQAREWIKDLPEQTRTAAQATAIAAEALGADEPKQTVILLQNGSEARGTGGFMGGYTMVTTDQGALTVDRTDTNNSLDTPIPNQGMPRSFYQLWGRGETAEWNSFNQTRHFPFVGHLSAAGMRERETPVDQVLATDAYGVAALLAATGPVSAGGVTVTADDAVTFFNQTVYEQYPDVARKDEVVAQLMQAVTQRLGTGDVDLPALVRAMTPVVTEGRLVMWSADPEAQAQLETWPVGGAVPLDRGPWAAVALNNSTANKLDAYVASAVSYDADTCGGVSSVTVTLTNNSPEPAADERFSQEVLAEPVGTTRMMVDVYGPVGAEWKSARIDGKREFVWQGRERNHPVWKYDLTMARGQTSSLTVEFKEPPTEGRDPVLFRQAMAVPQVAVATRSC